MSVEERLDRIERILEDLQARGKVRNRNRDDADVFQFNGGPKFPNPPGAMHLDLNVEPQVKFAFDEAKKAEAEARHAADEARRAVEEGQRAVEEGKRAAEEGKRNAEQAMRDMKLDGPNHELEALRNARESLQREMDNIQRQIKRLEEDRNRDRSQRKGRTDDSDDGPKNKTPDLK